MLTDAAKLALKNWLEAVSGVKFTEPNDIVKSLKDGVILCKAIEKLRDLKTANYHKDPGTVLFKQIVCNSYGNFVYSIFFTKKL